MQLRKLFEMDDERAVSPVIGVILMVAITVILAAVIGTFVLGLGDSVQTTTPNANFNWDQDGAGGDVTVTHDGGDAVEVNNIAVTGDLTPDQICDTAADPQTAGTWGDERITAGDDCLVETGEIDYNGEADLRLTWESGDQSSTLSTFTAQDS